MFKIGVRKLMPPSSLTATTALNISKTQKIRIAPSSLTTVKNTSHTYSETHTFLKKPKSIKAPQPIDESFKILTGGSACHLYKRA